MNSGRKGERRRPCHSQNYMTCRVSSSEFSQVCKSQWESISKSNRLPTSPFRSLPLKSESVVWSKHQDISATMFQSEIRKKSLKFWGRRSRRKSSLKMKSTWISCFLAQKRQWIQLCKRHSQLETCNCSRWSSSVLQWCRRRRSLDSMLSQGRSLSTISDSPALSLQQETSSNSIGSNPTLNYSETRVNRSWLK